MCIPGEANFQLSLSNFWSLWNYLRPGKSSCRLLLLPQKDLLIAQTRMPECYTGMACYVFCIAAIGVHACVFRFLLWCILTSRLL